MASYFKFVCFFFSGRRRHTRWPRDWSSDVCSSDLIRRAPVPVGPPRRTGRHGCAAFGASRQDGAPPKHSGRPVRGADASAQTANEVIVMAATEKIDMSVFERRESEVRSYSRGWPTVFDTALGSRLRDETGLEYLDFFGGAGVLNYGHNNPVFKEALLDYISRDGVAHSLDMASVAKREFLESIESRILTPRGLDYKVQFPGPTGTNAVEAALKLARKVTGRESVINFTNAFHGMTLGSLSVTGNSMKRGGAGIPLVHATPMPFDNYFDGVTEDFHWFSRVLDDSGSGLNRPAAVIVETVQGEGGVNVAGPEWLRGLAELCAERDILLIVAHVQMGCGRTGPFFSIENAGLTPDIGSVSQLIAGRAAPQAPETVHASAVTGDARSP